ncbi:MULTISPECIES: YnfA family protein [unclassified Leptolyngbya]|uniref:YnfA family protein n=1 Tax=unclassified Leptolyngbya TaxID=2650499 RepID=UPI001686A206|nr:MULTISPECIES: YnfA family protein [unclassified Leptolyngbya]MBD1909800.1 YnfA family protein [Leptolyngbya sp. FACHB-8]MBD2158951.1 YnfA family protein [Leptolyngbya sp. FACHB-16]
MTLVNSLIYFVLAGLCEIGGGYLIWLWIKEARDLRYALIGGVLLFLYGIIPTLQSTHFGRIYAAYGGVFIVLSILWGWRIDGVKPDHFDVLGGFICLLGVYIMMYAPRP